VLIPSVEVHPRLDAHGTIPADRNTIPDLLRWRAVHQGARIAFRFLADGGPGTSPLTYAELHRRATAVAGVLRRRTRPGDRVVLLYPPGQELITGLLGCLSARVAGVLIPPPNPARWERFMARAGPVIRDAAPALALTTTAIGGAVVKLFETNGLAPSAIATQDLPSDVEGECDTDPVSPDDLALLQYTSGSTGEPKGVRVSHGNLIHNLRLISEAFATRSGSRSSVVWLPPYHDMGLIGGILSPIYVGSPATVLRPEGFIQRPRRWLEAISATRATVSGGPNFAYELCVRRVTPEQRAGLDLSCWEVAFTGAEPIDPRVLRSFSEYFACCGFDPRAFKACYGLAEATLLVSAAPSGAAPSVRAFRQSDLSRDRAVPCPADAPEARALASCGRPASPVVIVHPETLRACPEATIGEIWVAGSSVASGYWGRPAETEETYAARIADTGAGPYLRTGDLGFLLGGELFVSGRLKELIIIDGQNHYPQDIERTVRSCLSSPNRSSGECAAFAVPRGAGEALVVVLACRLNTVPAGEVLRAKIQSAIAGHHDLRVFEIVLVQPSQIPVTPSGKVRRHLCRDRYLAGQLEPMVRR
jgi:acyl-CoA synthetase (AMP-forming)/AMP-acid ligase II